MSAKNKLYNHRRNYYKFEILMRESSSRSDVIDDTIRGSLIFVLLQLFSFDFNCILDFSAFCLFDWMWSGLQFLMLNKTKWKKKKKKN